MANGNMQKNYFIPTAASRLDSNSTYVPLLFYPAHENKT
jgi:hypothetical protein